MAARSITKSDVMDVLKNYDFIEGQDDIITIYSRILIKKNKKYIYRVFVNRSLNPVKVITVYRTSKTERYGY
jgi:hypothetical protein